MPWTHQENSAIKKWLQHYINWWNNNQSPLLRHNQCTCHQSKLWSNTNWPFSTYRLEKPNSTISSLSKVQDIPGQFQKWSPNSAASNNLLKLPKTKYRGWKHKYIRICTRRTTRNLYTGTYTTRCTITKHHQTRLSAPGKTKVIDIFQETQKQKNHNWVKASKTTLYTTSLQ